MKAGDLLGMAKRHQAWCRSGGAEGAPACFDGEDLRPLSSLLKGFMLTAVSAKGACMVGLDLAGAQLQGANLEGADLRAAHLQGADLRGARLTGANLTKADLREALLGPLPLPGGRTNAVNLTGVAIALRQRARRRPYRRHARQRRPARRGPDRRQARGRQPARGRAGLGGGRPTGDGGLTGAKKGGAVKRRPRLSSDFPRPPQAAWVSPSISWPSPAALILMLRGFIDSGSSRFREIDSRPSARSASVTTT